VLPGAGNSSLAGIVPEAHDIDTVLASNTGADLNNGYGCWDIAAWKARWAKWLPLAAPRQVKTSRFDLTELQQLWRQVSTEKRFEKVPHKET
jgi:hypothetical protein